MATKPDPTRLRQRLYLDHAATTPLLPEARAALAEGLATWANPSSPHAEGRAARAALEAARESIKAALGWRHELIFTSGASEAIAIVLDRTAADVVFVSAAEHDAVLRAGPDVPRLAVDGDGRVAPPPAGHPGAAPPLIAVQHVNNETGVIHGRPPASGWWFADCAQSAGKIPLPDADLIAVSAHKLGGPPGIGALLVRDPAMLRPSGGQERGYRGGTENVPAALGFAAALAAATPWMDRAAELRARLEAGVLAAGGEIVAAASPRIPTIGSYRLPGVPAASQLIRLDMAGIAVSAGSACSSGSVRPSHVLAAMGWTEAAAREVIRVSFGPETGAADVDRFLEAWRGMARQVPARAA
nr:aminotransferase class V-fold PLP-dependent enzyme [Sphingomonas bacterium]